MATEAVKQEVLNWLYSVLTSEYHNVSRTYHDVAETLARYPTLTPRTDVHTFDDGTSVLLLHLVGTVPVRFQGVVYQFPIALLVPYAYPQEAPIVYVRPTEAMAVRPGQHVDLQGKVYHPYLVAWAENCGKSNILNFCELLREVFSREPPVISRLRNMTTSRPPSPPPRPGIQRPTLQDERQNIKTQLPQPCPKPAHYSYQSPPAGSPRSESGPLLPPLPRPPKNRTTYQGYQAHSYPNSTVPNAPQSSSSLRYGPEATSTPPLPPIPPYPPHLGQKQAVPEYLKESQHPLGSGSSPIFQYDCSMRAPPSRNTNFAPHQIEALSLAQQKAYPSHRPQHPPLPPQIQTPPPPQITRPPPPPDLLSTSLVSPTTELSISVAPAIPSNPEKKILLTNIAHALHLQRQALNKKTESSLVGLKAQKNAMFTALAKMEGEIQTLELIRGFLTKNTEILHNAMRDADSVIISSQHRAPVSVDELLVAPTVVANQLYELVSDERSLGDVLFILGRAVERGRVSAAIFAKMTRSLAREWYLKKALVRKIGQGMGLSKY
ncbi:hypothetical protein K3495_g1728 [Podosphaera aphanis]|nr:hypothetical protein K3495_g1728 [Podosphaera aphanis]